MTESLTEKLDRQDKAKQAIKVLDCSQIFSRGHGLPIRVVQDLSSSRSTRFDL